ncbi:MAG: Gfo/Idh/MocA family oxidoreductase [Lentisphaeria bacterium]|nr:Gfo/Idh/MocA family oxidoreductase [Lentisphaeria bacterium]NQZ67954.1 Gfo/Idh/MocA family oxidoreductase [Lentisphaeria bacterium]
MSDPIRIGIVGAGDNTKTMHIPKFQAIDNVEIVAVCNRSMESGQAVADEFNIPNVYENWTQIVDDHDIDAVMIGTWPYMHHMITIEALLHNKHVLCEARMAMNLHEAREMYDASRGCPHLVAQVVPSPFTFAFDETIKELIADGYIGDMLTIDLRGSNASFIDSDAPFSWRLDKDLSGNNIMMMGIWYEAMTRWTGHCEALYASSRNFVRTRKDPNSGLVRPVAIPDHLDIIADFQNGAQARMQFSAVQGHAQESPEIYLFGTEGTLLLQQGSNRLLGAKKGDGELKEIAIAEDKQGTWRVEEEFIGAIRGEEEIRLTSFAEGVKYMEFTEAVNISMANGQRVSLPIQ